VDWKDSATSNDDPPEKVTFDTDLLFSVRARAGLAFDNMLLYATAGAATTHTKLEGDDDTENDDDPADEGDLDVNTIGFVAGGGLEFAFDENWSVRAEGLYYTFGEKDIDSLTDDTDDSDFIQLDDIVVVRAGVNFRF
jgi:outer membrane immunogenic protein